MARALRQGGLTGPYLMAPLYGYFLAGLYALRDLLGMTGPGLIFGVQALLGASTAGMCALLGGRTGGRLGAWFAGLLGAIYPVAILYDAKLLSVTLATWLATLGALALLRLWDQLAEGRPGGLLALGAGLLLGLATVARGNLLLSMPLVLGLILWRGWRVSGGRRAALLLTLGLALPLSATYAHNAAQGSPALVSVNGGINLYRGNNPYFVDEAIEPFHLPAEKDALARRSRLVASVESDRALSPSESDRYWIRRTLATWGSEPLRYTALLLRKTVQVLGWREISDNIDEDHLQRLSPSLRWIPPLYGPLVALGLVGMVARIRRGRIIEDAPLLALLITGVLSVALFFVVARYRLPLVPLWLAFSAGGLRLLVDELRARHLAPALKLGAATVVTAGLLALSPLSTVFVWNWLAPENPRPECLVDPHVLRAPEVEDAYRLAFDAMMHGDSSGAERQVRDVILRDPGHVPAEVMLSYLLMQRGDYADAAIEAAKAAKLDPCKDKAWFNLGNALANQGKGSAALGAFHKAVELDPYDPDAHTALGQTWLALGNADEAKKALEYSVRWAPDDWKARSLMARIYLKSSQPGDAAELLDEALLVAPEQVSLWGLRGLAALGQGDLEGAQETLLQGEAMARKHPDQPQDPVLAALRKAIDAPFRMPDKLELVAKPRPGLGP